MHHRITKYASLAGLMTALLSSPGAVAADVGGTFAYAYTFKPEYFESDGPGNFHLLAGSVRLKDESLVYRLGISVLATNTPEQAIVVNDPSVSLTHSLSLAEGGPTLVSSFGLVAGASLASRDADYTGGVKGSLTLAQQFGDLTTGVGVNVTRHLYKYTRLASGAPSLVYSGGLSLSLGYAITKALSAEASLAYTVGHRYAGSDFYGYSNGIGMSYAVTDVLSIDASLSSSDGQLAPNGDDNNEFTLYKRNETEGSVGFTYVL